MSPVDGYLRDLCERAGLRLVWVSCQNGEPGCQAVDGDGMREFYSLAGLLASALPVTRPQNDDGQLVMCDFSRPV
jgi:hypothetical protein